MGEGREEADPGPGVSGVDVDRLYRDHREPLRRYVRHMAMNWGMSEALVDAEGIVNDTFVAMLTNSTTIENRPAWLRKVARNKVCAIAKQRQRQLRADLMAPEDALDTDVVQWTSLAPHVCTEDIIDARQELAEGIAELSGQQQTALYLRHAQGWSTAEIGDYLGCAPGTVSTHISRGKERLRNALAAVAILFAVVGVAGVTGGEADTPIPPGMWAVRYWPINPPPVPPVAHSPFGPPPADHIGNPDPSPFPGIVSVILSMLGVLVRFWRMNMDRLTRQLSRRVQVLPRRGRGRRPRRGRGRLPRRQHF